MSRITKRKKKETYDCNREITTIKEEIPGVSNFNLKPLVGGRPAEVQDHVDPVAPTYLR
jgi:hypothetical protein